MHLSLNFSFYSLKKLITKPNQCLQHVFKRLDERSNFENFRDSKINGITTCKKESYNAPTAGFEGISYGELVYLQFKLTIKDKDNHVQMLNGDAIKIKNFVVNNGKIHIIGTKYRGKNIVS